MHKIIRGAIYIFLLIGLSTLGVSCSDDGEGSADGSSGGGGGGGGTSPIDDIPVGEVDATGFWVNVITDDQFDHYLNKRDDFGTDCIVTSDTTTYNYMECVLDVLEGDLYMHDIKLQYNAPPGMCDHVLTLPAWFWNQSFGIGPAAINVDIDATGPAPIVTACTASNVNGLPGTINCSAHPELTDVLNTNGPSCIYDQGFRGRPNCCFGDVTRTFATTSAAGLSTSIVDGNWGGSEGGCIGPNISDGWKNFTPNGYPSGLIEAVPRDPTSDAPLGLNAEHVLRSNGSTIQANFSTWATWFETPGVANPHTHSGFYSASTSNLPYAYDPIDDLDGSDLRAGFAVGRPYWRFTCMDAGFEIRQMIDVRIREWNTLLDFAAYGTSEGVTYDPDVSGAEGVGCEYDPIFNPWGCNDVVDFDDILNSPAVGGAYGTVPGVDDGLRPSYFPGIFPE